jgi:hypothetical protein
MSEHNGNGRANGESYVERSARFANTLGKDAISALDRLAQERGVRNEHERTEMLDIAVLRVARDEPEAGNNGGLFAAVESKVGELLKERDAKTAAREVQIDERVKVDRTRG